MKRYLVKNDLQGGEFGKYRIYTEREWRKQAIEWATMDDNTELIRTLRKLSAEEIIPFIGEIWGLEFEEVSEKDYKFYMQGEKAYKKLKKVVYDWKGSLEEFCKKLKGHNLEENYFDLSYENIIATICKDGNDIYLSRSFEIWDNCDLLCSDWQTF